MSTKDYDVTYVDRGCRLATGYLGRPSQCQLCPFERCLEGLPYAERQEALSEAQIARDRLRQGMTKSGGVERVRQ